MFWKDKSSCYIFDNKFERSIWKHTIMAFEIPNIPTLGIELSVAFLILVVDQCSRRRERDAILRSQKIDSEHREQQHLQM